MTQVQVFYCPYCGTQTAGSARYCAGCGSIVGSAPASVDPALEAPQAPVASTRRQGNQTPPVVIPVAAAAASAGPTHETATKPLAYSGRIPTKSGVRYADAGNRFVAFLIDSVIVGMIASLLATAFGQALDWKLFGQSSGVTFVFFLITELGTGQSLGKRLMGIRLVDAETLETPARHLLFIHIVAKAFFLVPDIVIAWFLSDRDEDIEVRASQRLTRIVAIRV